MDEADRSGKSWVTDCPETPFTRKAVLLWPARDGGERICNSAPRCSYNCQYKRGTLEVRDGRQPKRIIRAIEITEYE